jgi:hypothetical protein
MPAYGVHPMVTQRLSREKEMAFVDQWGKVWDKSILAFTGRNKVAVRELEDVVKGTGELVRSLNVIDKSDPVKFPANKPKERNAALSICEKELKVLQKQVNVYGKSVDVAIKATDKDLHPAAYRELKVIRTHLNWLLSAVTSHLTLASKDTQATNEKVTEKIKKEEEQLYKKGLDDNQVKEATQLLKFAKLLVAFPTAAKTGAAVALKAIQTIKADPTPSTYNKEMDHGGRNYTQQLNNVIALAKHKDAPDDFKDLVKDLVQYDAALKAFGGGNKRSVELNADQQTILQLVKEYSGLVKATIGYVDDVNKYLTHNKKKLGL